MELRVVFGNEEEVISAFKSNGNAINTSYVERKNLAVKNSVNRLVRGENQLLKEF